MSGAPENAFTAVPFLPSGRSLASLREAAKECRGCPLHRNATQTVFGDGRRRARFVLVGEQPGNDEDLEGRPFVGPAGRILDQALAAAGIDRDDAFVTNVVKHFKWIRQGARRLHKKPSSREIAACLPWLERELEAVRPEVLICLGATAARSLLGRTFRVTVDRGRDVPTPFAPHALATVHPSSILRQPTPADRQRELTRFTADLKIAARLLSPPTSAPKARSKVRKK